MPLHSLAHPSADGLDARQAAGSAGRWLPRWLRRHDPLEDIRKRMLGQLQAAGERGEREALAERILRAGSAEALWALRHPWMQALQGTLGDLLARQRMSEVSFMFAGLLDREKHARSSFEQPAARGLVRTAEQIRSDH